MPPGPVGFAGILRPARTIEPAGHDHPVAQFRRDPLAFDLYPDVATDAGRWIGRAQLGGVEHETGARQRLERNIRIALLGFRCSWLRDHAAHHPRQDRLVAEQMCDVVRRQPHFRLVSRIARADRGDGDQGMQRGG